MKEAGPAMPPNNKHDKKKKGDQREEGGAKGSLLCCVPEGEHVTSAEYRVHGTWYRAHDRHA